MRHDVLKQTADIRLHHPDPWGLQRCRFISGKSRTQAMKSRTCGSRNTPDSQGQAQRRKWYAMPNSCDIIAFHNTPKSIIFLLSHRTSHLPLSETTVRTSPQSVSPWLGLGCSLPHECLIDLEAETRSHRSGNVAVDDLNNFRVLRCR
jgi:hypothetical protein